MQRRGLALGAEVALLQRCDAFFHVLPLCQGLQWTAQGHVDYSSLKPLGQAGLRTSRRNLQEILGNEVPGPQGLVAASHPSKGSED